VVLVACLLGWACAQEATPVPAPDPADPNGEITTAISGEPDTIDPQKESFPSEIAETLMVYEPLLTFDPRTLGPVPAAARALPVVSDDGLTVTFTLRDGLVYSDGQPLTAADFVYGWVRLCDPRVSGDYAFVGYVISGCERWNNMDPRRAAAEELDAARAAMGVVAVDPTHIVFTLTRPAPYFAAIAALWVGAPVRAADVASVDRWTEPATFIGNGPFRLAEWRHNERLVFERNDRYRAPAKIKRWTKVMIPEPAVAAAAFRSGEVDVIASTAAPNAVTSSGACTYYVGFNTAAPPFDDPAVRLAFARALDRDAFVRDVVGAPAHSWTSLIPPGLPGADAGDATQSFDAGEARALLASSRYFAGLPPIRFRYNARGAAILEVKWAIAQWKTNLGADVIEDPTVAGESGPLIKRQEQIPPLMVLGWCSDYPDPQDWLPSIFRSNSTVTHTGYNSIEFDSLVDRADVERDPAKRLELYRQAQRVLTKDAPVAFLYSTERRWLVSPRLRGYTVTASDWEFGQFTIATMYVARPGF
jgi:oligopeptide transport system substrate-binding protein